MSHHILAALCAVLCLTCAVKSEAASFGRTTVGTTASGGLRADFKRGSRFVLPERGTVRQICAYLDGNGGGTGLQAVRFALYRDRNGVPAEQVVETAGDSSLGTFNQPADWYCFGVASAPLEPGAYWVMIHTGGDPGVIRYFYDGPANWYGNADTFADGASDTFGVGGTGEGTASIRVDYFTESEARFAGRRNVGTQVSGPMSAQFKRGSSFVLTEGAQVVTMNAYVDGRGGATGSQPLWISLYDDSNGEPGALVARGTAYPTAPMAGRTARWVSSGAIDGPILLTPGRYWIVLHTGGPTGVLRYYSEGTGNWRGNANPGEEPSPFFGAANTGDGTITANILYTRANVVPQTLGRTTPGNIPSGGLSANFIRGSTFGDYDLSKPEVERWVTALWAYMDGNGGASGSQKVRLVLYEAPVFFDSIYRAVVSDEVTIRAGTPPGWVRFAVPRTFTAARGYYIMMLTGGAAGVARNYASNDFPNWHGAPLGYSADPLSVLYTSTPPYPGAVLLQEGNVTMSLYAEYLTLP